MRGQGGVHRCQSFVSLCVRGAPGRAMKDSVQDGLGAAHHPPLTVGSPCLPGLACSIAQQHAVCAVTRSDRAQHIQVKQSPVSVF